MQKGTVEMETTQEIAVGRESEELCLLAKLFNGFSNSTRLSILLLLARRGEMRVGELVNELEAPQSRISDHLRCLARCGYVCVRREGRNAYYSICDDRVLEMIQLGESLLSDNQENIESCDVIRKAS